MKFEATLRGNPALAALLDGFADIALPDAWLVAGALAQTVWNATDGRPPGENIIDIDLIYHDPADLSAATEADHEARLAARFPLVKLDVKNQARVHLWYERRFGRPIPPFRSSADAIATFPTPATAVGVRMSAGRFEVYAPFGIDDLRAGIVRPNKAIVSRAAYEAKAARWQACWPLLTVAGWDKAG